MISDTEPRGGSAGTENGEGAGNGAGGASGGGDATGGDNGVADFATYEDYLDSQIQPIDLFYLEDKELARQLVELGYRGSGEPLKREEFESRKKAAESFRLSKRNPTKALAHQGKDLTGFPFLQALADREEANRSGKLTSIIFLRTRNAKKQEISGYIDYAHRLKCENFEPYFSRSKLLLPRPSDLSFYNWETQTCTSNNSPNFQVMADNENGLLFKNKRDRKIINVDPKEVNPGDNTTRLEVPTTQHIQVVIYDHLTRRKVWTDGRGVSGRTKLTNISTDVMHPTILYIIQGRASTI
ncbi:hypothetical protein M427DRAFT_94779 [Gonapodya prolifera JEL478]|uniref:Cilia- and flagella-associated protein 299 n=1 Tax=Gonapodya prolifera (strain JEL478) TaxID=1344416 RepID=A0A139AU91_GONPJ|nr:hypothetical protein M427DRAFT_94779 [Gonapodya prolifera JEL478]|eukprot:KXS20274.1 hypothetical protein M427DRAFT_94779 [Gonapodya prolifera JEL478]